MIVGVVIVVIACLGAAAFGAMELRDYDTSSTTATKAAASANADPRTAAVLAFCGNRKPIRDPEGVAPFVPGKGAVAYAQLPQPASSTEEAGSRVLQVSPVIGNPNLSLEKSIALVNVAVCVDQSASTPAQGTCDYDLTNPSSVGQKATSRLLKTTYRAKVYEMRTGKLLTSGTLSTPVDRCPGYAYIGGKGVSNPLTEAALVAWLGQHLVGGVPQ